MLIIPCSSDVLRDPDLVEGRGLSSGAVKLSGNILSAKLFMVG